MRPIAGGVAIAFAVALAGCGITKAPTPVVETFAAPLSASQVVPAVDSAASGDIELLLNQKTNAIQWRISHRGLSGPVTAAYLHGPAGPGQNAPAVVPFAGNLGGQPLTGNAHVTPEQAMQLLSGQWYVNLHTARHPQGELRGQLRLRR